MFLDLPDVGDGENRFVITYDSPSDNASHIILRYPIGRPAFVYVVGVSSDDEDTVYAIGIMNTPVFALPDISYWLYVQYESMILFDSPAEVSLIK